VSRRDAIFALCGLGLIIACDISAATRPSGALTITARATGGSEGAGDGLTATGVSQRSQEWGPPSFLGQEHSKYVISVTAMNAKFSNYGLYLHRVADSVKVGWNDFLRKSASPPPSKTYVMVGFLLNSKGEIVRVKRVTNHSSDVGAHACMAALTNRAPYGDWTDDMKATLNPDGEELVFTFYYE
jgi:hypothetical protein